MRSTATLLVLASLSALGACASHAGSTASRSGPPAAAPGAADQAPASARAAAWRSAHRLVDMHVHVDPTPEHLSEAVRVMDAAGVGVAVNLSGGTVTHTAAEPSELERTKALSDQLQPGRFLEYMNLDYTGWDAPDFAERAVRQVEEGARQGAAGFKEFKRLGLYLRDASGQLLRVDDPKLDPMWHRLGELGMPVSIHVADPKAFWGAYDETNERWKELKDHPRWWFGDPAKYPRREELLAALERVVARHPETTFVCVHFANNAEDLDWVDAELDAHPNMLADIAARVPEIGRHDPARVRALFVKHAARILFATDFQVYDRMTLGSGGSGPPPTEADAVDFFQKHWRFFETADRNFPHMTPIQGDFTISGIDLPADVLSKIYFENAERLLRAPLERLRRRAPAADAARLSQSP
ncbi:MAG TPA: amidohydrolase family protein [Polyangiaceae bacterium]|nr:amidohydrolase family protein [Polyangiaceae bacterium]